MATVMFQVTKWPSGDRLLDALKYGRDPKVKFRVDITIEKPGCLPVKLEGVRVSGYVEKEDGWVELTLVVYKDIDYHNHFFRSDVAINAWVSVTSRGTPGTIHLTQR
jgi:hypothetical protein